jgi:hypothetical protein
MGENFLMESGIMVSSVMAVVLLASILTFAIFSGKLEIGNKNKKQNKTILNRMFCSVFVIFR